MTRLFYSKRKSLLVPDSFQEVPLKRFLRLAPILYVAGEEVFCKVHALRILSGASWLRMRLMRADAIRRALPYVDWAFEGYTSPVQFLPKYKGLYGPASDFDNLRMNELHATELYYARLVKDPEDAFALACLVAILYRPGKKWIQDAHGDRVRYDHKTQPDGDSRVPFNYNVIENDARRIQRRWPRRVLQAVFLWYDACRERMINNNKPVFTPSKDGFESQYETGLYGMIRSLAGDRLGPIEKVEQMYVHTAMLELGLILEEDAHLKQLMESKKTH